jgi:hypothetical protein
MFKPASSAQVKAIHAILARKGLMDQKQEIISSASSGRTQHSRELSYYEAFDLLKTLNDQELEEKTRKQRMINSLIAMAHEMGWITKKMVLTKCGVINSGYDYSLLHSWLENNVFKKKLNEHSYQELTILVSVFKKVYYSWLKNKKIIGL